MGPRAPFGATYQSDAPHKNTRAGKVALPFLGEAWGNGGGVQGMYMVVLAGWGGGGANNGPSPRVICLSINTRRSAVGLQPIFNARHQQLT